MDDEIVWLFEDRRFAVLVSRHAYFSIVRYSVNGHTIELEVMNDDYEYWREHTIDYEHE